MSPWLSSLLIASTLLWASVAQAESVPSLEKKLLGADDFRVRTQAALALGASGSKAAVRPLCKGLDDKSDTVRAAAAAGLGRLAKGGESCLEARGEKESSRNVKRMIAKALRLLLEAKSGPTLGASTRYYVSVGPVSVRGPRTAEISRFTAEMMKSKLTSKRGVVFAPSGESKAQANKRLRKYPRVAGYHFETAVLVEYTGRDLVVEVEVSIFGYPDKQPQGSLSQMAGYSGLSGASSDKENELIEQTVAKTVSKFRTMAGSVD